MALYLEHQTEFRSVRKKLKPLSKTLNFSEQIYIKSIVYICHNNSLVPKMIWLHNKENVMGKPSNQKKNVIGKTSNQRF